MTAMPVRARPPKPRRFWLYAPYVALLIAIAVWSAAWGMLSQQAVRRMDDEAQRLRDRGWTVAWSQRRVDGYPFRLDVSLSDPRIAEPSGWALAAPQLNGEAYAYAPHHWVLVAPQGLTVTRPGRGAVTLAGQALRASIAAAGPGQPPRIAVEGRGLTLTPAPGAKGLPIVACDHLGLYLRPRPDDQAEFQLQLQGAAPAAGGMLARMAPGQPFDLIWDQTVTRASALKGSNWPAAVRAWGAAGGVLTATRGEIRTLGVTLVIKSGDLAIGPDGKPQGALSLDLSHAGAAPGRLGPAIALASAFRSQLRLANGSLLLGPFRIAAAPRVY